VTVTSTIPDLPGATPKSRRHAAHPPETPSPCARTNNPAPHGIQKQLLCGEIFFMPPGPCDQVVSQSLRTGLAG
jgi:hypothetical protein